MTDANVVLGRLSPESFLGGEMRLDRDAAERPKQKTRSTPQRHTGAGRLRHVAGGDLGDGQRGAPCDLERGLDPRDFTLVAYGGGGPLHSASVAKELSIGKIIIPNAPGHFSALGMLMADLRRDYVQTLFERLDDLRDERVRSAVHSIGRRRAQSAARLWPALDRIAFERAADMRYVGQEHAVAVGMPANVAAEGARAEVKRRFDEAHDLRYSHSAPEESADIVSLRVSAIGRLNKPVFPQIAKGKRPPGRGPPRRT